MLTDLQSHYRLVLQIFHHRAASSRDLDCLFMAPVSTGTASAVTISSISSLFIGYLLNFRTLQSF